MRFKSAFNQAKQQGLPQGRQISTSRWVQAAQPGEAASWTSGQTNAALPRARQADVRVEQAHLSNYAVPDLLQARLRNRLLRRVEGLWEWSRGWAGRGVGVGAIAGLKAS